MKIALVLPGSIWYAPYVRIYTRLLDSMKVDYSIISWNREGYDKPEGFQFVTRSNNRFDSASLLQYCKYVLYIRRVLKRQKFNRIIVFGPQLSCLLSPLLLTRYRGKYMVDYRDLSIEQKRGFRQLFAIILYYSKVNVISSPGFKKHLPSNRNYFLSHNFDVDLVKKTLLEESEDGFNIKNSIQVLTIGSIRNRKSNMEVVRALANNDRFQLKFVGKSEIAEKIEQMCIDEHVNNVSFVGFYEKKEESSFVRDCTFLNIFYPRLVSHDAAISNRFYNSLIYKRPMIVTKDTIQGDLSEEYDIGIAIKSCDNLVEKIESFLKIDFKEYAKRCNELLSKFLIDQQEFEDSVKSFCDK